MNESAKLRAAKALQDYYKSAFRLDSDAMDAVEIVLEAYFELL